MGVIASRDPKFNFYIINKGYLDDIKAGDLYDVFRANKLIGRIKITRTSPSVSVGLNESKGDVQSFYQGDKLYKIQHNQPDSGNSGIGQLHPDVSRPGAPSLDIRLTGFGGYDARFFAAISISWKKLIKDRSWAASTVKVDFNLYPDGRIDNLKIHDTTAASILQFFCREAISQPAPYEAWSKEMREQLGPGPRRCRITFNYLVR